MLVHDSIQTTRQGSIVRLVGMICLLTSPWWVYGLFFPFPSNFPLQIQNDVVTTFLVLICLFLLQILLIHKISGGNHFLGQVMLISFFLKLAAVSTYIFAVVHVYESVGDVFFYFTSASEIVNKYALTGDWTILHPFWSTNFIIMVASWLIFILGHAFQPLMIIFATISFWGQYLFYRAYCIAFPNQQHKTAALFMFFLPSPIFWTATIGKDAIIFFFIGGCCYGFAKLTQRIDPTGFLILAVSLGGVMMVRPHVAGMLVVALGAAYLVTSHRGGPLGVAVKSVGLPLLFMAALYFIAQAKTFVDMKSVDQTQKVLERAGEVNLREAGTKLNDSLAYRLLGAPFLLFRPFPWEVKNPQMAVASVEAFGLMIFFWRRRTQGWPGLSRCRQDAFFLFLWLYLVSFSFFFAGAMTNFGLLARERDMLIPLALMIFLSRTKTAFHTGRFQNAAVTCGHRYNPPRPQPKVQDVEVY